MQVEIVDLKRELFWLQKFMNKDIQRVQLATGKHIWLPAGQMKIADELNNILCPSLSVTHSSQVAPSSSDRLRSWNAAIHTSSLSVPPTLSVAEDRLRSWPAADNHSKKNNNEKKESLFF